MNINLIKVFSRAIEIKLNHLRPSPTDQNKSLSLSAVQT